MHEHEVYLAFDRGEQLPPIIMQKLMRGTEVEYNLDGFQVSNFERRLRERIKHLTIKMVDNLYLFYRRDGKATPTKQLVSAWNKRASLFRAEDPGHVNGQKAKRKRVNEQFQRGSNMKFPRESDRNACGNAAPPAKLAPVRGGWTARMTERSRSRSLSTETWIEVDMPKTEPELSPKYGPTRLELVQVGTQVPRGDVENQESLTPNRHENAKDTTQAAVGGTVPGEESLNQYSSAALIIDNPS